MTRVGIVGCGSISHFHHEGYHRAGASVAHVCDLRREAADQTAALYGAKATTDYHQLLADPEVDLVSVCTISSAHKEIVLAAIAAGKGVVCEKTLSDNPADSFEMAQAADKAGVFLATAYMKNYFPATQQAMRLLAEMGPVTSLHARTWQPYAMLWEDELHPVLRERPSVIARNYGGGVLVCGGSHILDLIHHIAGRPTRVCGQLQSREGMDVDRQANALLWLRDGGMAHFEAFWHPMRHAGYERNGWDERLEINTPAGRLNLSTVLWDHPTRNGALLVHEDAVSGKTTEYRYPAVNPFDIEMAEMVRRFEAGEPGYPSGWDGYVVDELIATITAGSEQGQVLAMRWRDE